MLEVRNKILCGIEVSASGWISSPLVVAGVEFVLSD